MKLLPILAVGAIIAPVLVQSPPSCEGSSLGTFRVLVWHSKGGAVFPSPTETELTLHPENKIFSRAFIVFPAALRTLSRFAHRRFRAGTPPLPFEAQKRIYIQKGVRQNATILGTSHGPRPRRPPAVQS